MTEGDMGSLRVLGGKRDGLVAMLARPLDGGTVSPRPGIAGSPLDP